MISVTKINKEKEESQKTKIRLVLRRKHSVALQDSRICSFPAMAWFTLLSWDHMQSNGYRVRVGKLGPAV